MSTPAPLLAVEALGKRFGGLTAVDGLSFELAPRQVLGLIGPNGSGKTTTLNLISGALRASAGSVRLDGRELTGLPAHKIARAGVARTFQLVRVLPGLSVRENVIAGAAFARRPRWGREAADFADALLERLGLAERRGQGLEGLTYIDQKRLELARALAAEPRLLLLDEWLAGLNPTELAVGIELIAGLREDGHTIILVEHVMDAIRALCGRCVVMNSGVRIAEGTPEEVLSHRDVVRAYLGEG